MREVIINNMQQRFGALSDLAAALDATDYSKNLAVERSKSIGEHFWCLVGARESYFRALEAGEWQGFDCSLKDHNVSQPEFIAALNRTADEFSYVLARTHWALATEQLLAELYEHEVMHEGQLIRLIYGLHLTMPASSKWA